MKLIGLAVAMGALAVAAVLPGSGAQAQVLGGDAAACTGNEGPAFKVVASGLKDRTGRVKIELFPATPADFLQDDNILVRQGKVFRRIEAPTPPSGPIVLCIRAPRPGRYALFFTHDRVGQNKFSIWKDGAGVPSNQRLGTSKPQVGSAMVEVGNGVTTLDIRVQYLKGPFGFGPIKGAD